MKREAVALEHWLNSKGAEDIQDVVAWLCLTAYRGGAGRVGCPLLWGF